GTIGHDFTYDHASLYLLRCANRLFVVEPRHCFATNPQPPGRDVRSLVEDTLYNGVAKVSKWKYQCATNTRVLRNSDHAVVEVGYDTAITAKPEILRQQCKCTAPRIRATGENPALRFPNRGDDIQSRTPLIAYELL